MKALLIGIMYAVSLWAVAASLQGCGGGGASEIPALICRNDADIEIDCGDYEIPICVIFGGCL